MINIRSVSEREFEVTVEERGSSTRHLVTLDDVYYKRLTGGRIPKQELVEKSFKFLLERESKESILRRFDLKEIGRYFPEYEERISG